ncbi:MAG: divergent polysaccharide deacetylase family protein [Silicimonas sp.]|nr:divergent polysaccharide deacetylase family protein [Silicimonas sp.]
MLFVSSQAMDRQELSLPQPEATAVEVPGGTEFDQAREESDPVLPEADARPDAGAGGLADVPQDAVDTPPSFDTSALQVPTPSVGAAGGLSGAPETGDAPLVPEASSGDRPQGEADGLVPPETPALAPQAGTAAEQPVAPVPEAGSAAAAPGAEVRAPESTDQAALAPGVVDQTPGVATGTAPAIGAGSTAPGALEAPSEGAAPLSPVVGEDDAPESALPEITRPQSPAASGSGPAISAAPSQPVAPVPDTDDRPDDAPDDTPADRPDDAPDDQIAEDRPGESFLTPVETFENRAENVETNRLPRIGGDAEAEGETRSLPGVRRLGNDNSAPEEEAPEETAPEMAEESEAPAGPAILSHARPFENTGQAPLLALILVQEGGAPLSTEVVESLPEGVAYGLDAGDAASVETAARYRAAEREVVMIPALPAGARPQDVEQALRANFERIPEAVAIMDLSGTSFQSDRAAVQQVVDVVQDSGHGMITFPRGLNTAHQAAGRAGVPTGLIFRRLDGSNETADQIRRTLDRAAFRARNDAAVILVGSTAPETVVAILEWAAGNRAKSVAIAPISAALMNQ